MNNMKLTKKEAKIIFDTMDGYIKQVMSNHFMTEDERIDEIATAQELQKKLAELLK